jgi:predicted RNA binding protein with dsRBD fold (UPF0201 family)
MVEQRLRLTGKGEGLSVTVLTELRGADSPQLVFSALTNIFPDLSMQSMPQEPVFGHGSNADWSFQDVSMATFLKLLHEQRILDTALDAMSMHLEGEYTHFNIARVAAMAGKIAFPIPGESPLGGTITVELRGSGLDEWLQAATWHTGRSQVPRSINDELAMDEDGEASTWL